MKLLELTAVKASPPRFCSVVFYSPGLQWPLQHRGEAEDPAHGPEEKRQVVHPEGCLSQNVSQRDTVLGEHEQDLPGRRFQQLLCEFSDLGLPRTDWLFWPYIWLWDDLPGNRSADICHRLPGKAQSWVQCDSRPLSPTKVVVPLGSNNFLCDGLCLGFGF